MRNNRKGKNNSFFGKKHSIKSKQLISLHHADVSGVKNPRYGVKLSKKTRDLVSKNHADFSGVKHPCFGRKFPGRTLTQEHKNKLSEIKKKNQFGKNNPMFGKHHKPGIRCNHHIYLRPNPKVIRITFDKHRQLHARAYDYLVETYGPESIDNYMAWFTKKYGLKTYG